MYLLVTGTNKSQYHEIQFDKRIELKISQHWRTRITWSDFTDDIASVRDIESRHKDFSGLLSNKKVAQWCILLAVGSSFTCKRNRSQMKQIQIRKVQALNKSYFANWVTLIEIYPIKNYTSPRLHWIIVIEFQVNTIDFTLFFTSCDLRK